MASVPFCKNVFAGALLLTLLGCAAVPEPQAKDDIPACAKLDDMLHAIEKNARYAYTADAIDSGERVHMWFINPKTHDWIQIRVYDSLQACVEQRGGDWHWAIQ